MQELLRDRSQQGSPLNNMDIGNEIRSSFGVVQNNATETENLRQIANKKLKPSPSHFHMPLNV